MRKKDNIYKLYQQQVRDKDTAVTEFMANTLAKTQSMFEYEGLPDSKPQGVLFVYYIKFNDVVLQGNIIQVGNECFTYIHAKTTPIKDEENALIYSLEMNGKPNYKRNLLSTASYVEQQVARFFAIDKVFYQDNEIGEIVRNYLITSAKTNIVSLK